MARLIFSNPGELDVRAAITLGVNVKENDHPHGYFGTGLKYAIARLLANGQELTIQSGMIRMEFSTTEEIIRGKSFQFIWMSDGVTAPQQLGFTTELGKHWEPWMVYRELYTNCVLDEGGEVVGGEAAEEHFPLLRGVTSIIVEGGWLAAAHEERRKNFLINRQPIHSDASVEIYLGQSRFIFYRGCRVHELETTSFFTYNILDPIRLTEDRNVAYSWEIGPLCAIALLSGPPTTLGACLGTGAQEGSAAPALYFESSIDWDQPHSIRPSADWAEYLRRMIDKDQFTAIPNSLIKAVLASGQRLFAEKPPVAISGELGARIEAAKDLLDFMGIATKEVKVLQDSRNYAENPDVLIIYENAATSVEAIAAQLLVESFVKIKGIWDGGNKLLFGVAAEAVRQGKMRRDIGGNAKTYNTLTHFTGDYSL